MCLERHANDRCFLHFRLCGIISPTETPPVQVPAWANKTGCFAKIQNLIVTGQENGAPFPQYNDAVVMRRKNAVGSLDPTAFVWVPTVS